MRAAPPTLDILTGVATGTYSAEINWGDGTVLAGTVSSSGAGDYTVAAGTPPPDVRYNIALFFLTSKEDFGDDVTDWFTEYLQRAPTADELQHYVNEMLAGESDRQIEQEITNLPAYGPGSARRARWHGREAARLSSETGGEPAGGGRRQGLGVRPVGQCGPIARLVIGLASGQWPASQRTTDHGQRTLNKKRRPDSS